VVRLGMKCIKILILTVLVGGANTGYSQPYQLIPCNDLFKRSRASELVHDGLLQMVYTAVNSERNRVIFLVLLSPNREPERAIVVYQTPEENHFVEIVVSPIDTNYSILDQVQARYKHTKDVPSNPVFDLPQMKSLGRRKIASSTAILVEKALEVVLAKSGLNEDDRDENREIECIPGLLTKFFIGRDNNCGLMLPVPYTGAPRRLAQLGETLEKYQQFPVSVCQWL